MRHLNFSLLGLSLVMTFCVHAADFSVTPPDIARVKQRGELVVAMYYEDVAPFCMRNSKTN